MKGKIPGSFFLPLKTLVSCVSQVTESLPPEEENFSLPYLRTNLRKFIELLLVKTDSKANFKFTIFMGNVFSCYRQALIS